MSILIFTIAFPSLVYLINFIERVHLRERRLHDALLYSLCQVRDDAAALAVEGKLSEKSQAFQLFYTITASMIHNHRASGLCFRKLIKRVDASIAQQIPKNGSSKLDAQISEGSDDLKLIAVRFSKTFMAIVRHAYPLDFVSFQRRWHEPKRIQQVCKSVERSAAPVRPDLIPVWA